MLSIAHTATGAFIAAKIPNPLISIPLILASHYLEDYIVHWDVGTGLSKGLKKKSDAFKHEIVDLIISFLFIYFLFQANQTTINYQVWMGAFVSLIPDFVEAPKNFFKWEPKWLKPFNDFHGNFHNSTPNIIKGLTPQIILLILITLFA